MLKIRSKLITAEEWPPSQHRYPFDAVKWEAEQRLQRDQGLREVFTGEPDQLGAGDHSEFDGFITRVCDLLDAMDEILDYEQDQPVEWKPNIYYCNIKCYLDNDVELRLRLAWDDNADKDAAIQIEFSDTGRVRDPGGVKQIHSDSLIDHLRKTIMDHG